MINFWVNVFSGEFADEAAARAFAAYCYDEDDNATSDLATAIGSRFSPEYQETIWGDGRFDYIESLLIDEADVEKVKTACRSGDNTFFLVQIIRPARTRVRSHNLYVMLTASRTLGTGLEDLATEPGIYPSSRQYSIDWDYTNAEASLGVGYGF